MIKHNLIQATKAFVLLVAFYLMAGLAAYLVPDWRVRSNVQKTVDRGDLCEDYPQAILPRERFRMDNFTDALIVNQALMLRTEGLCGIMMLPRHQVDPNDQCGNLAALLAIAPHEGGRTATVDEHTTHYARYWHGSTFITRILLAALTFTDIRYALYILTSLLLLWCCLRLWRTAGRAVGVVLPFSLLMVNVYVMQFSMQFAPVLVITLGTIIWMTYRQRGADHGLAFFVAGSLTAFLDLITVPSVTIGLPLVAWIAIVRPTEWKKGIGGLVSLALWWAAGYALTWIMKWGLATLLTGADIFADAYGEAAYWSNDGGNYIAMALSACLGRLRWIYILVPAAVLSILAIVRHRKGTVVTVTMYAIVMLIPFVYYLLMARPAWHHNWFNYRALVTAVAALLMMLATMVDWKRIKLFRHE